MIFYNITTLHKMTSTLCNMRVIMKSYIGCKSRIFKESFALHMIRNDYEGEVPFIPLRIYRMAYYE